MADLKVRVLGPDQIYQMDTDRMIQILTKEPLTKGYYSELFKMLTVNAIVAVNTDNRLDYKSILEVLDSMDPELFYGATTIFIAPANFKTYDVMCNVLANAIVVRISAYCNVTLPLYDLCRELQNLDLATLKSERE